MTRPRSVIIAFVVLLLIFVGTHILKFPGSVAYLMEITHGQPILDLRPSFSSAETYQRLEVFGEAGREMYLKTVLVVDVIFPVSAFIFLFLLARYTSEYMGMKSLSGSALRSLSIAYVTCDFLENVTVVILLLNFPTHLEFLGSYIGYLTVGKRVSMIGAALVPLVLLAFFKIAGVLQYRNKAT